MSLRTNSPGEIVDMLNDALDGIEQLVVAGRLVGSVCSSVCIEPNSIGAPEAAITLVSNNAAMVEEEQNNNWRVPTPNKVGWLTRKVHYSTHLNTKLALGKVGNIFTIFERVVASVPTRIVKVEALDIDAANPSGTKLTVQAAYTPEYRTEMRDYLHGQYATLVGDGPEEHFAAEKSGHLSSPYVVNYRLIQPPILVPGLRGMLG